jgi:hypothetical protein
LPQSNLEGLYIRPAGRGWMKNNGAVVTGATIDLNGGGGAPQLSVPLKRDSAQPSFRSVVIPAKAGIQGLLQRAGGLDSCLRGNDN